MAKRPGDRALLEQAAKKDETAGDFVHARSDLKAIIDGGHAATVDYNLYGWLALFNETSAELFDDAVSAEFQAKATRIAESLQLALFYRPDRPWPPQAAT